MLQNQIDGKISSWAIRWLTSTYLDDMYCLYPSKSLVLNDGFDGSGTNCEAGFSFESLLTSKPIEVVYQTPRECKKAWKLFCKIFKSKKDKKIDFKNLISRILPTTIKKFIKRIIRRK